MNFVSYNINGIRAALKKGLAEWVKDFNADIVGFQEIKANVDQFSQEDFKNAGYYDYWFSAEKKGYSGVAVLTKKEPQNIQYGIGIKEFDAEGRFIQLDFENFSYICSYFPSGTTGTIRQDYKMAYLDAVINYLKELEKKQANIIIAGDFNICHKPIDINHPERHKGVSGFLPEERAWIDDLLNLGYTDTFRNFNENPEEYSWWSYRAQSRAKNLGWRIDYHFASKSLKDKLTDAKIHQQVVHSDHCPVSLGLSIKL